MSVDEGNPRCEEFIIPSLSNFVVGGRGKILLSLIRVLGIEQFIPACANQFNSASKRRKWGSVLKHHFALD